MSSRFLLGLHADNAQHMNGADNHDVATAPHEAGLGSTAASGSVRPRPQWPRLQLPGADRLRNIASRRQAAEGDIAGPSSKPKEPAHAARQECAACMDQFQSAWMRRAPCSHTFCETCLTTLYTTALESINTFPPQCCGREIPLSLMSFHGSSRYEVLARRHRALTILKENEGAFYCSKPTCSGIIPGSSIHDHVAACPQCETKTCTKCKGSAHDGQCPEDPAMRQLQQLAGEQGWTRCVQCNRIVELAEGCIHMSRLLSVLLSTPEPCLAMIHFTTNTSIACRCGAQFCYLCGRQWRTCRCENLIMHHMIKNAPEVKVFLDRVAGVFGNGVAEPILGEICFYLPRRILDAIFGAVSWRQVLFSFFIIAKFDLQGNRQLPWAPPFTQHGDPAVARTGIISALLEAWAALRNTDWLDRHNTRVAGGTNPQETGSPSRQHAAPLPPGPSSSALPSALTDTAPTSERPGPNRNSMPSSSAPIRLPELADVSPQGLPPPRAQLSSSVASVRPTGLDDRESTLPQPRPTVGGETRMGLSPRPGQPRVSWLDRLVRQSQSRS